MILIKNCKYYSNQKFINGDILIDRDIIIDVGNINEDCGKVIDGEGKIVIPGLIDIHMHGAIGYNVMDASIDDLNKIANFLAHQGTTSFLPTTITSRDKDLIKTLQNIKNASNPNIIGVHIEGPYINKQNKGCHDENLIKNPEIKMIAIARKEVNNLHLHYTIAPELPNAIDFIKEVIKNGGTVSLGHSNATMDEALQAISVGANIFTHLFNAMRPFHHREPGIIGAALKSNEFVEVICDGIHVHPDIINLVYKIKGKEKIVLVTDAMQACGLGDGTYNFGGFKVIVKEGIARKEDGTLASSTLTIFKALKNAMKFLNIPLEEAIDMATINPAKALGIDNEYGSIDINKKADLIMLDNNFNIDKIINKGKLI